MGSLRTPKRQYAHWNWMLVENGESCEERNVLYSGMWSLGKGPAAAKDVKFNAVMTIQ